MIFWTKFAQKGFFPSKTKKATTHWILHIWISQGTKFQLKDTITVYWKTPIFQSKQPMTKLRHISLNSQFTVVLNRIICFSVRFCDNSLLVLKQGFQVFSFTSKMVQGFSSDRKILMSLLSVLFHLQNRISIFRNLNFEFEFSQDIWGNVHYVPEIYLISQGTLIKAFYLPKKTI